jgi:cell fate (sporulation/competence/biofilm development) regulator YlbF (YheA/YmcA/DUF963 family)
VEAILELAQKLGEAISHDSRFSALREAQKKIEADAEARKLLADFQEQSRKLMELERRMAPIEPEDKRRLRDLHEKVAAHPLIKQLTKARMEYVDLMAHVNRAISSGLGEKPSVESTDESST